MQSLIPLGLVLLGAFAIGLLLWLIRQQRNTTRPVARHLPPTNLRQSSVSHGFYRRAYKPSRKSLEQVTPKNTGYWHEPKSSTVNELLTLTNGDRQLAERLVKSVQSRNPGQTAQWCWEKALYDLQRDRRA
ncbi:MAG: hypothetical protein RML75_06565 [Cyanobacteriota bacterium SKYGB_h_bin112]|nr:hypothetical protein [Cyanobacteriota bacterium SKYGB_h_bin112]